MSYRRKKCKRQRKIIVASVIGLLCIMSAGYAAFQTNLNINAKGNITSKGIRPNELKNKVVTSGDGLYKDTTEEGRYIYKGSNPDNYITFNGKLWRIIAIEKDETLKIVRNESLDNIPFDPGYSANVSGVTNENSVEGTRYTNTSTDYCYYNSGIQSSYYGCNVWGSKSTMLNSSGTNIMKMPREAGSSTTYDLPEKEAYLNTYLNETWYQGLTSESKNIVDIHLWNVGPVKSQNGQTLDMDLQQESIYKWRGKVGLLNVTDYVKANTNKELCGNVYANSYSVGNYETCKTTNWLFNNSTYWVMTPFSDLSVLSSWFIYSPGYTNVSYVCYAREVRPVLFIKSNIFLKGSGTFNNPYVIK